MARHDNHRLYIGPKTKEIVIGLGRAYGVEMIKDHPQVTLSIKARKCGDVFTTELTSYAVDEKGKAHFNVAGEFISDGVKFPQGFYDAKLSIGECSFADIEMVKAPGHYPTCAKTIDTPCDKETKWVEPDCTVEQEEACECSCNGNTGKECDCSYQIKNNCPTCYNEVCVATADIKEGYLWDN